MNSKHHLASGQVVIAKEKNNTLLIQEHTQPRIDTRSLHAPAKFSLHCSFTSCVIYVYKSVSSSKAETNTLQNQGSCIGPLL